MIGCMLTVMLFLNLFAFSAGANSNINGEKSMAVYDDILIVSDQCAERTCQGEVSTNYFNENIQFKGISQRSILVKSDASNVDVNMCLQLLDDGAVFIFENNSVDQIRARLNGQAVLDEVKSPKLLCSYVCKTAQGYSYGQMLYAHSIESTHCEKPEITAETFADIRENMGLMEENAQAMSTDSDNSDPYNLTVGLYHDNQKIGQVWNQEYVYLRARYIQNEKQKSMWDVLSFMRVSPEKSWGVEEYDTRIHCNVANQECIQDTYLNSSGEYTGTLNLGITGGYKVIQGNVNYSFSYAYDNDSQIITNHLPYGNVKEWYVEVVPWREANSWHINPAIRFINHNDANQLSGAWTQVTRVKLRKFNFLSHTDANFDLSTDDCDCGGWFS